VLQPRLLPLALLYSFSSGASDDTLHLTYFAENRRVRPSPEASTTRARLQRPPSSSAGRNREQRPRSRDRHSALKAVAPSPSSRSHRSSPEINFQCASPDLLAGNLARGEPLPQISFRPFDLDRAVHNMSLTRTGIARSGPSIHL
jgi:hypothetical protein